MPWLGWKAGWFVIDIVKRRQNEIRERTASEDDTTWGDDDPNDIPLLQMVIDEIEAELAMRPAKEECILRLSSNDRLVLIEAIDALQASRKVTYSLIDNLRRRLLAERGQPIPPGPA